MIPLPAEPGPFSAVRVMGVVNVTPDSFSDGGRFVGLEAGLARARGRTWLETCLIELASWAITVTAGRRHVCS